MFHIYKKQYSHLRTAIGQLIAGAFFLACDHASIPQPPKGGISEHASCGRGGIKFYRKRRKIPHSSGHLHLADKVSLLFRTQKNGVKNSTVNQWRTWKHLCIVQLWVYIVTRMDLYPGSSDDTPVNTVWVENHRTTLTS